MLVRSPRARRLLAILGLAAPLCLSACKTTGDTALGTPGNDKVDGEPMVVIGDELVDSAAELLPANTVLMLQAASPTRLAQAFERDRLLEEFGAQAKMATGFLSGQLGFDPFDPAAYADVGIDPAGPIGFAVIDGAAGVFALFARVGDLAKLKQTARDTAARQRIELTEQDFGGSILLRDPKESKGEGVVIRGQMAAFVMVNGEAPIDYADRMAKQPIADSLARTRGYRRAMGSFDRGDLLVFADVQSVVAQAAAAQSGKKFESWADSELAAAKERGASAEEIERLQQQADAEREATAKWHRRDEAAAELASLLTLGVEGTAWRMSAKSSGVFLEGRVALSADAFLRDALRNTGGRSLFATSLSGEPAFLFEGSLDPDSAQQIVELMLEMDGYSWLQLAKDLQTEAGLDLENELWPQVAGDAGFAVTIDEPLDPKIGDKNRKRIGVAFRARVKDPNAARELLQKADAADGELGKMLEPDGERWAIDLPDYRKLHVELAGDHLLIATDGQLGVRLSHASRGTMGRQTDPAEAWAAMMMPDRTGVFALDMRTMMWLMLARSPGEMFEPTVEDDVPMSRTAKAKQKEIDEVQAKIDKVRAKRDQAEFDQLNGFFSPFGITVVTAAMDDRGIDIVGGQLTRNANVSQLLEATIKMAASGFQTKAASDDNLFELIEKRDNLQAEFREIREADRAKVKGKSRGGSKRGADAPAPAPKTKTKAKAPAK